MLNNTPAYTNRRRLFLSLLAVLVVPALSLQTAMAQGVASPEPATPTTVQATPVKAPGAAAAKAPNKFAALVSLSRIVAPMLQLKLDYALDDQIIVGGMLATGSPRRQGLTSYSQSEIGAFASFYALGTAAKGLGAVAQVRGFTSSGTQNGENGENSEEIFTASGKAFSASGFLSARLETSSRLVLQADAGLSWLYTTGTATGGGKTTEASGTAFGRLINLWVGASF